MVRWLRQVFAVVRYGLMSLPDRLGAAASTAFGIAGVVAVMVGVLSIAQGFQRTMQQSAADDTTIILRDGANSEMMSGLTRDWTRIVADTAGVKQGEVGPLSSAELFVVINLPKRNTGTDANVPLRGVEEAAFEVRDGFEIIEGRNFLWGRNEVIAGVGAVLEFEGIDFGASLEVGGELWKIVGIFETGGGIAESEIWTDAKLLQSAYRRGDSFQAVYTKLESPAKFTAFKDALDADPRLTVDVYRQDDYYSEQSSGLTGLIRVLGIAITVLMAFGAVFGALNTMYSAVSSRTREIATMRALGFKSGPVILSVLSESFVLALVGGTVGGVAAYLAFDGFRAATLNFQSFSQVAFAFDVTPGLVFAGIVCASIIGFFGGLFPAIRAARMPVADALREG